MTLRERRIRIGNQTAYSAAYPAEPFEYAVANGFDAFEWFPDKKDSGAGWTVDDISSDQRAAFRKTAEDHDIAFTVHLSFAAEPSAGRHDLILRELAFARDMGAVLVNTHLHAPQGIPAFAEALVPLWREASSAGLSLSIENTVETGPEQFNELFRLLRRRLGETPGLGICLDMGHANLCSATRNDYLSFVDRLDPDIPILHLHMHENFGDGDTHLTLFTGPSAADPSGITGLVQRLRQRGFAGCMILEQWPHPHHLLQNARARLLHIMARPTVVRPPDDLDAAARFIVEAHPKNPSWRKKLGWVHDVLTEDTGTDTDFLAYLAIYLRFVGTGQLPCAEDGGHYRPSHHARLSQRICRRLLRITTPENNLVVRKIYPWLPSFDDPFLHAEPLTRIRDIAHRNDIPQDLKQEIKTTLQNKLHRSAGPEDLVTSAALLRRITAPGAGYSPAFVEEFARFHRELEEFFNARSLEETLSGLAESGMLDVVTVGRFRRAKDRTTQQDGIEALQLLVGLRSAMEDLFPQVDDAVAQRLRLADIGLEDFSFSLLSSLNNSFHTDDPDWRQRLKVLALAVANVRLSGLPQAVCRAIESELAAWSNGFDPADRLQLLRMRATVERARRIADAYCGRILELFPRRAAQLGAALGVPPHAVRQFAESDIRAHPVFQVSRLTETLGAAIRRLAGLPPWDIIVPGAATGRLHCARTMYGLPSGRGPLVLAVDELTGEEELPPGLAALLTPKNIPHLSHLAVRARQGGVVFAVCEDAGQFGSLRELSDGMVLVDARSGNVTISTAEQPAPATAPMGRYAEPPEVLTLHKGVLSLDEVTAANAGPKALSLRRLAGLAPLADFEVAGAIVLPFGSLEEAVERAGVTRRYHDLVTALDTAEPSSRETACAGLAGIIGELDLPPGAAAAAARTFGRAARLMVRSSASTEDRQGSAEAGLYRSVANVPVSSLLPAVREVWSSLWSRRAVTSRRHAGIPGRAVRMAVILQEMVVPRYSFIMHTVHPLSQHEDEVYLELAAGLGEVLASGSRAGTPYRVACNQRSGRAEILAFADLDEGLRPGDGPGDTRPRVMDYSSEQLSLMPGELQKLSLRIARIGKAVESYMGGPQDIEGCVADNLVFLVQTRLQAGY